MSVRVWAGCVALAVGLFAASAAGAQRAAAAPEFRRGIGLAHVLGWAPTERSGAVQFAYPPFADRVLADTELGTLRRSGFDFVRLAVDPGPFLQFGGAQRDELDRLLADRVRQILAADLSVIVDFHPGDLNARYDGKALARGAETPVFRDYLRLLTRTATLLGRLRSTRVALEIFNEPPVGAETWQPMLEASYTAVRRGARDIAIVLDGGDEGMADAMMKIETRVFDNDPAVLFTFHYYAPYQFTHQGASWNDARHLADVPYPAGAHAIADSIAASNDGINASEMTQPQKLLALLDTRRRLEAYRLSGFDRRAIARDFDRIAAWAAARGISGSRILLGEFGVMTTPRGPRASEREQWFRDVREEAEARGFGWAAWVYRNDGFGLTATPESDELEPAIVRALGLAAAPAQRRK